MKSSIKFIPLILAICISINTNAHDRNQQQQNSYVQKFISYSHEAATIFKDWFMPSNQSFFGHDLLEALEVTHWRGEFASLMDRLLMDKNPRFTKDDLFSLTKAYGEDSNADLRLVASLTNPKKLQLWHYIQANLKLTGRCHDLQVYLKDKLLEFWWKPDLEASYPLIEVLSGPFKKLKLSGVCFTPENLTLLQANQYIEEVSFKKSILKNSLAKVYGENLSTIKVLRFIRCIIGTDFMSIFMTELMNKSLLTGLYISDTALSITDAEAIARYLKATSTLERLHLAKGTISSSGGLAIVRALENHTSVKYLNLSSNPLGDEVVQALATVLQNNQLLNEIFLEKTQIVKGQTAVKLIEILMDRGIEIKNLALSDVPLSLNEARMIARKLTKKKVIQQLLITDSGIKSQELVIFVKLMTTPQAPNLLDISPVDGISSKAKSLLKRKYPKLVGSFLF
jgi:hypothetical protein